MSLAPGARIGPYEIVAKLGEGGMGEVWRATDTHLGRQVAIKVLPDAFANDIERLARFEREAKTLASLNHPNIAAIYGLEKADGVRALVMELVEGPTLADRIARGAIPIDEALPIARQIADALEAAHEQGIIHRDLKPANVKVREDGTVKVLDFGLAKAIQPAGVAVGISQSPTVTSPAMTQHGVILGTAPYMSPEQARGTPVDRRTDIWSFGCVLYEMLTGQACFRKQTVSDTLVAILDRDPDWSVLPATTPRPVLLVLRRCLEKHPRRRLRDIGDARLELDAADEPFSAAIGAAPGRTSRLPWAVAVVAGVAAIAMAAWAARGAPVTTTPGPPVFSRMVQITMGPARDFAPVISPDNKWIAYISDVGGRSNVWLKFLGASEPVNLTAAAGLDISTSSATGGLDVAPDGTRIAVQAKPRDSPEQFSTWEIPAPLPGTPRKVLDTGYYGMRWSPDGSRMAYIRAGSSAGDAIWVADGDGTNRREIVPASGGAHMHWLAWSQDGHLFYMRPVVTGFNLDQTEIYRVDADGGTAEPVVSTLRRAMFPVPLANGALIYSADASSVDIGLWWRGPNDRTARRLTLGLGDYMEPRVSADGRILVATRFDIHQSLVRIETSGLQVGRMTPLTDGYGGDLDPDVVPNSKRLVFSSTRAGNRHLWTADMNGANPRPLTSGASEDHSPAISPNSETVAFISDRGGQRGIWVVAASGGAPRKLVDAVPISRLSWSPDGSAIVFAAGAGTWPGLWRVTLADGKVQRIATPGAAGEPAWSPTGELIAYLEPATTGPAYVSLAFVTPDGVSRHTKNGREPTLGTGFSNGMLAWAPDGRRVVVLSQPTNAVTSVWIVEPTSAAPYRKVADLPIGPRIRGLTWTPDGSAIIIGQYDATGDIILLEQEPQ